MISLIAIIGLVCIIIGTSLVSSKLSIRRRYTYPLLVIGGICLLAYSIYLKDTIFIILQAVFIISSLLGLIRINEKYLRKEIKKIGGKR
jgi:lipid-A-disaccharide synthase-like uncharacterized protein